MSEAPEPNPWGDKVTEPNCFPVDAAVQVPTECTLYRPGHNIHQIQMRHALNAATWESATVLETHDGHVQFATDEVQSGWNHDPAQLQAMWDFLRIEPGAFASWCPQYRILMVSLPGLPGAHAVYLGDQESACSPKPMPST